MKHATPRTIKRPVDGAPYYVQYIAARSCPICGHPLHYFTSGPQASSTGAAYLVELICPSCRAAAVDAFLLPAVGNTEDARDENMNQDMQQLADIVLKVSSSAYGRVQGIRLR